MTGNTTTLCCHRVVGGIRAPWRRRRRWWIVVLAVVICSTDVSEENNSSSSSSNRVAVNVANALQQPIKSSSWSSSSSSTSSSSISSTHPRNLKAQLPPPISSSSSSQPSSTILDHFNSASKAATTATSSRFESSLKASSLADDIMDSSSSDTITATGSSSSSSISSSSLADEITRNLQKRTTVGVDDISSNDSDIGNAQLAIWKLAAAGAVATVIGDVSIHPIDSIKTLQQSDEGLGMSLGTAAYIMYSQFGGISAFYKGFLTYGICDGIGGALKFATYEGLKRQTEQRLSLITDDDDSVDNEELVVNNMDKETILQILLFIFAGMSFVVSSIVTVPGELLKQHLQMGHYVGFWDALTAIIQSSDGGGIADLYTGYDGVFVRDVPYTAMELGLYDLFKTTYVTEQLKKQQQQQDESSPVQTSAADFPLKASEQLLIAGLTGGVAGFLTTPFDTVKTKLMVDVDFAGMSFWDATMVTVHDHGVAALFCGALARVAWLVPNTAIYLPTYDFLKNKLQEMDISSTSTASKDDARI
eukprot:CAMPEP_0113464820 /NCGR_PEP_ID=MMETSP0014_2-20120614/13402_1 /TAXON_ID=2857 /ORGANISM="Nitzschia sp." /LENGTH=532 /DNA_ID=CAMNT_0000356921 /DNA_START=35 /DNA_END=1633 /DNA_ORIENTATION=- /assembly_acc=CAM_ASM_000159